MKIEGGVTQKTRFVNCQPLCLLCLKKKAQFGEALWHSNHWWKEFREPITQRKMLVLKFKSRHTCSSGLECPLLVGISPMFLTSRVIELSTLFSCPWHDFAPRCLCVNLSSNYREGMLSCFWCSSSSCEVWAETGEGRWVRKETNEQEWRRQVERQENSVTLSRVWAGVCHVSICLINSCLLIADSTKCLLGFLLHFFLFLKKKKS